MLHLKVLTGNALNLLKYLLTCMKMCVHPTKIHFIPMKQTQEIAPENRFVNSPLLGSFWEVRILRGEHFFKREGSHCSVVNAFQAEGHMISISGSS